MSVVASYRTKIRLSPEKIVDGELDPTWRLMEEAVEATAQELGGRVSDQITDYFGNPVRCTYAVLTPNFPRGVGVRVDRRGDVTFVYDHYDEQNRGYKRAASEIAERITQNYTALAVAKALAEMEYSVEVDEATEGPSATRAVVVRGSL